MSFPPCVKSNGSHVNFQPKLSENQIAANESDCDIGLTGRKRWLSAKTARASPHEMGSCRGGGTTTTTTRT